MATATIIPAELKTQARQKARDVLSQSQTYRGLDITEQQSINKDLVNEYMQSLGNKYGLSKSMESKGAGGEMGFGGYDPGFDSSTTAFDDLVESVDFPRFVADLMKAVFDANITVMKKQTDD